MAPNRRSAGRQNSDEISDDFPHESEDPRRSSQGPSFAFQAIMEMQKTMGELGIKIDRLLEDRKEDRLSYKEDMRELKSSFGTQFKESKEDFKEFRDKEFVPVRNDVANLKLKWAKVAGIAAAIGVAASFLLDLAKKHFGG